MYDKVAALSKGGYSSFGSFGLASGVIPIATGSLLGSSLEIGSIDQASLFFGRKNNGITKNVCVKNMRAFELGLIKKTGGKWDGGQLHFEDCVLYSRDPTSFCHIGNHHSGWKTLQCVRRGGVEIFDTFEGAGAWTF